eukprot:1158665-Pelagomonas_calceolata.AAC.1
MSGSAASAQHRWWVGTALVTFPQMMHLCGATGPPAPPSLLLPSTIPPSTAARLGATSTAAHLTPAPASSAAIAAAGSAVDMGGSWNASSEDAHPLMRAAAAAREAAADEMGGAAADLSMRGNYA